MSTPSSPEPDVYVGEVREPAEGDALRVSNASDVDDALSPGEAPEDAGSGYGGAHSH